MSSSGSQNQSSRRNTLQEPLNPKAPHPSQKDDHWSPSLMNGSQGNNGWNQGQGPDPNPPSSAPEKKPKKPRTLWQKMFHASGPVRGLERRKGEKIKSNYGLALSQEQRASEAAQRIGEFATGPLPPVGWKEPKKEKEEKQGKEKKDGKGGKKKS